MRYYGTGTQKAYDELKTAFPDIENGCGYDSEKVILKKLKLSGRGE